MRRLTLFVLALGVAGTACSSGPEVWGEGRAADQLVLRVDIHGGLLTIDFLFPPRYSIYADGTVYFVGGVTPGLIPLAYPVTSAQLDDAQLAHLSSLIEAIGLPDVTDYLDSSLRPSMVDGFTTTATYFDRDGGTHSYGVYALGPLHETPESDALSTLVTDLNNMTAAATNLVDLSADRLQLHWRSKRRKDAAEAFPWPLTIAPRDFGGDDGARCTVITGDAALEAAEKLATTEQESVFVHNNRGYHLVGRVLLPGEEGCVSE